MKEDNRLVCYRLLMSQSSGSSLELSEDAFCRGCKNHRPDFKYRFCAFVECQEIKGMTTYREKFREEG